MLQRSTSQSLNQSSFWSQQAGAGLEFKAPFNLDELEKHLPKSLEKDIKILDFGCGYGRILNFLYHKGYRNLSGVDYSEKMIERCQHEYPHLKDKIQFNNEKKLPFENGTFDLVILFSVLTCNVSNEEQRNIVDEIKRVLKPGGVIYINDYLISHNSERVNDYNKTKEKSSDTPYGVFEVRLGSSGICRHHSYEWMNELFNAFDSEWYLEKNITTIGGDLDHPFQSIARFHPGKVFTPMIKKEDAQFENSR
jgi:SAM-dependent methyltransferase